ncbi:MAG: winged helix-turn-helix domain-containing protein [Phycisphaeraceae bacterium]|nr:winged helix-turn-helix domain-containing protein [Phycisphaeraceae bacterium]
MSKKPPTKTTSKTTKATTEPSANDKARADALAKLNAKQDAAAKDATKRPTPRASKPARGTKPDAWQNDPLESDAALEAAIAGTNAAPTIAHDAKSAKATRNATAAKGSPKGERGATSAKTANGGKDTKTPKPPKPSKAKRISALDAAAKVLAESDRPLRAIDMIEVMHAKGLWTSPGGKTPEATLYAAIIREISAKGKDARFKKVDRGMFTSTPAAKAGKAG